MKVSNLHYFVEVATSGSFTKAAEKLFISQPTLSRRIQELENEIGVTLFNRHSHELSLTTEGELFLVETTEVLKKIEALTHLFDSQLDKSPNLLKIGYLANFDLSKLFSAIELFKKDHPETKFLMKQDTPMNLIDGLNNKKYDVILNLTPYLKELPTENQLLFSKNQLEVVLPVNHSLSQRKNLAFSDLKAETFILLERQESPLIVDYVISQFIKDGFNLRANSYVTNLEEGLAKVSVGEGLAFLYSGMNDGRLAEKYQVKIVPLKNQRQEQNLMLAFLEENPLIDSLIQLLK